MSKKIAPPDVIKRLKEIAAASVVYVLPQATDATLNFAILDPDHPEGGYINGFPLADGITYALVPLLPEVVIPESSIQEGLAEF